MGRININFNITHALGSQLGQKHDKIPGKDLAMVIQSLPGETFITGATTGIPNKNSLYFENTVEAENDQLPDGAEVLVRYIREIVSIGGILQTFSRFDGIVITQPKPSHNLPAGSIIQPAFVQGSGSLGPCQSGHNWVTYNSGMSSYDYCSACGVKK